MPVVEESIVISSPPEVVFDYLADPRNVPEWDSSIVTVVQEGDDELALGTRWKGTTTILGRRIEWTTAVTELDAPKRLVATAVEGKLQFTTSYELSPVGSRRTHLTFRIVADSGLGGAFGRFADGIVEKAQGRAVRSNLKTLATLLGSAHPASHRRPG